MRRVGRRLLERAGFEVIEAGDGPEAVERFRGDPEGIDVVLLDLTLPSADGISVMGDFTVANVPAVTIDALSSIIAMRFHDFYVNPNGTATSMGHSSDGAVWLRQSSIAVGRPISGMAAASGLPQSVT